MHFLHFLFLLVRITFVKPNMFLTCARKTGSHPGGGRLPDTHRRPPVPPLSPTSVDPPHLVPLPSHRTLVRLPGAPVFPAVLLPSPLRVRLLTCTPLSRLHRGLSPAFLSPHLCLCPHTWAPSFHLGSVLSPSPQSARGFSANFRVRLRYLRTRQVSFPRRKGTNIFF